MNKLCFSFILHPSLWKKAGILTLCLLSMVGLHSIANSAGVLKKKPVVVAAMDQDEMKAYAETLQGLVLEEPNTILSLLGGDVRLMLADPDLERSDNPIIAWQYQSSDCVLDIYFKDTHKVDAVDGSTAIYYETRIRRGIEPQEGLTETASCLKTLYDERRPVIEAQFLQLLAANDLTAGS